MKTLKFKLYKTSRDKQLRKSINASGQIWNHCLALQKRYYRMFKKTLNKNKLQKHLKKLRNKNPFWLSVGSQAVQDITDRLYKAWDAFFDPKRKGVRPPKFKKIRKYKSFTLKQAGYKFLGGNRVKIGSMVFQYWNSREIEGQVKTVTVKRTPLGELFICVVVETPVEQNVKITSGRYAGFDFGLKDFLTVSDSEGWSTKIQSPQFLKASLNQLAKANQSLSRKVKGSANWERARKHLCRVYEKIVNQRTDWFWKMAHKLTDLYDNLYFETLNLDGMKRLWGRKISDLAFGEFIKILSWVAKKKGKTVSFIDRWFPSSKLCSNCGHKHERLELSDRVWRCGNCGSVNDRDENAATNILNEGSVTA